MMSFSLNRFLVISTSVSKVDLASTVTFTSYDVPSLLLVRKYPFLIEIVKNCLSSAPADNFKRTFLTPYPSFDKRCALKRTPCSPLCFSLVKRIFFKLIRKTTKAIIQVTTFVAPFPYSGLETYTSVYKRQTKQAVTGSATLGLISSFPNFLDQIQNFPISVMFLLRGLISNLSLATKFYSFPRRLNFLGLLVSKSRQAHYPRLSDSLKRSSALLKFLNSLVPFSFGYIDPCRHLFSFFGNRTDFSAALFFIPDRRLYE